MALEHTDAVWLDDGYECTLIELTQYSGLTEIELRELVELGSFVPERVDGDGWRFGAQCVVRARKAGRLRQDFDLEPQALALVLALLDRIDTLESEVLGLEARMPRLR
jgi:chaperone modulatory protein CbpM